MKKTIALILIVAMVASLTGCAASDYKKATASMADGDYAAALEMFEALEDYKDSAEQAQECSYQLALKEMNAGNYAAAQAAFEAISDYSDSAAKALESAYQLALEAFNSGDFQSALAKFEAIAEYSDSAQYITKAENEILKAAVLGEWATEKFNISPRIFEVAMSTMDTSLFDPTILNSFSAPLDLTLVLTFEEDGTMTTHSEVDPAQIDGFIDAYIDLMYQVVESALEISCQQEGITMQDVYNFYQVSTPSELFTMYLGMSVEDLVDSIGLREMLGAASTKETSIVYGVYLIEDGSLIVKQSGGKDTCSYDAASDTLTVDSGDDTTELGSIFDYPAALTRR